MNTQKMTINTIHPFIGDYYTFVDAVIKELDSYHISCEYIDVVKIAQDTFILLCKTCNTFKHPYSLMDVVRILTKKISDLSFNIRKMKEKYGEKFMSKEVTISEFIGQE